MQNDRPYRHLAIESIIQHLLPWFICRHLQWRLLFLSVPELDKAEVAIPVSNEPRYPAVKAKILATIGDWGCGWGLFPASLYEGVCCCRVVTLRSIKAASARAFRAITGSIYRNCL